MIRECLIFARRFAVRYPVEQWLGIHAEWGATKEEVREVALYKSGSPQVIEAYEFKKGQGGVVAGCKWIFCIRSGRGWNYRHFEKIEGMCAVHFQISIVSGAPILSAWSKFPLGLGRFKWQVRASSVSTNNKVVTMSLIDTVGGDYGQQLDRVVGIAEEWLNGFCAEYLANYEIVREFPKNHYLLKKDWGCF
jgi:hypothetical protein